MESQSLHSTVSQLTQLVPDSNRSFPVQLHGYNMYRNSNRVRAQHHLLEIVSALLLTNVCLERHDL